jgi:hypothetical protein
MTGAELRALMREHKIKTIPAANALGIHPQTIRNLWTKDEVPKLYMLALMNYVFAITPPTPETVMHRAERKSREAEEKVDEVLRETIFQPKAPPPLTPDPWSRLK